MVKSEQIAKKILEELEGFKKVTKILLEHNFPSPIPDFVAIKKNKSCIIEVKTYNPDRHNMQPVYQRPNKIDYIMIINMKHKKYVLLEPALYFEKERYIIKPKKIPSWNKYMEIAE